MKADELKIGNYVYIPTMGEIILPSIVFKQVRAINIFGELTFFDGIDEPEFTYPALHCTGVPITEEWLLKLGIKDRTLHINGVDFRLFRATEENGQDCYVLDVIDYFPLIRYVHQLQNLYFTLTGKELTINK